MRERYSKNDEEDFESIPLENLKSPTETIKKKLAALDKMPVNEAAKLAVSLVGPKVYKLTGIPGDKLIFYIIGCSGNGKKSQADVARLMDKMASRSPESRPAFIISAGDFIYPGAPPNPTHHLFKTNFHDIYYKPELETLSQIPTVACLGNHEELRYKGASFSLTNKEEAGIAAALNVVAANYVPDGVHFKKVSEIVEFFQQDEIDARKLQALTIPYYYFAFQFGDIHITFANSNSLPKGFLEYSKIQQQNGEIKSYDEETYQIPWLIQTYQNFKKMFHLHVMHHPRYPIGKRAIKPDTGLHLSPSQQKDLNSQLNSNVKFLHEFINLILEVTGLKSKAHISAHEHLMDLINTSPINPEQNNNSTPENSEIEHSFEPEIRQIGAGGGGGDLQRQEVFPPGEELGTVLSRNGFWEICIDKNNPKDMDINLYALDYDVSEDEEIKPRFHLKFNLQGASPIRIPSPDKNVEALRSILLGACKSIFAIKEEQRLSFESTETKNQYVRKPQQSMFSTLRKKVGDLASDAIGYFFPEYKPNDIDFLHDLIADLNQPVMPDMESTLDFYFRTLSNLENKSLFIDEVKNQVLLKSKEAESNYSAEYFLSLLDLQSSRLKFVYI